MAYLLRDNNPNFTPRDELPKDAAAPLADTLKLNGALAASLRQHAHDGTHPLLWCRSMARRI